MNLSDFDYELSEDRIAQHPVEPRDAARLFVLEREPGASVEARIERIVRDLPDILEPGDLLVVNDTRVVPARLCGARASGGAVELLVLGPAAAPRSAVVPDRSGAIATSVARCHALVRPAGRLRPGERIELEGGALVAVAVERTEGADGRPGAEWTFDITDPRAPRTGLDSLLERHGRMPLPPYIRRPRDVDPHRAEDRERYQTIYSTAHGAVAAPTAGLHFTPELLERLAERGVERASVTLHVGAGTFLPVTSADVSEHRMHAEAYVLGAETARAVERARARRRRVVAVGTTSVRVLETCVDSGGRLVPGRGETSIFLRPGDRFRCVDSLITNFHLPRSTLLMLVAAFAGRERVLAAYREAIAGGFRFYSYGDAMLIL